MVHHKSTWGHGAEGWGQDRTQGAGLEGVPPVLVMLFIMETAISISAVCVN